MLERAEAEAGRVTLPSLYLVGMEQFTGGVDVRYWTHLLPDLSEDARFFSNET